jgi:hypothetical protein
MKIDTQDIKTRFNMIKRILRGKAIMYGVTIDLESDTTDGTIVTSNTGNDPTIIIHRCQFIGDWEWDWAEKIS